MTTSVNKQKSGIPKPKEATTFDMDSYKKMLEEKEFAVGQVEFLNSIIVDMKQKNEELQSKIQILENGYVEESSSSQDKMFVLYYSCFQGYVCFDSHLFRLVTV